MRVAHAASGVSARFDDLNIVSCGGLAPALSLARRCGLHELVAGHGGTCSRSATVAAAGKPSRIRTGTVRATRTSRWFAPGALG